MSNPKADREISLGIYSKKIAQKDDEVAHSDLP